MTIGQHGCGDARGGRMTGFGPSFITLAAGAQAPGGALVALGDADALAAHAAA